MAGLVRWIASREILPGSACAKYPEDAVEDVSGLPPGSSPAIFSARRFWDQSLQHFPLFVGEVHAPFLPPKECATSTLYPPLYIYELASSHGYSEYL